MKHIGQHIEICENCGLKIPLEQDESLHDSDGLCESCWYAVNKTNNNSEISRCVRNGDYEGACLARDELYYHGYC